MRDIESRQNAKFKNWKLLLESRGIKAQGLAIVSGRKLFDEFLNERPEDALELITTNKAYRPPNIFPAEQSYRLPGELFAELDLFGTDHPLLVVRAPALPAWEEAAPSGLELVLALSDPGNLGAVIRSAEAFGVGRIILAEEAASPYLPKALRAASGSVFRMKFARAKALASLNLAPALALDIEGEDLASYRWPKDFYLVLGEEGRGLPQELNLQKLRIPMQGRSESLNAMAAASIALYAHNISTCHD